MSSSLPLPVVFFRTESGREPVREWLLALGRPDSMLIGEDLRLVQRGWPIGMPTCRTLGGGLYETRTNLPEGRAARVFFGFHRGAIVVLHGIIKKTQTTPGAALRLARERLASVKEQEGGSWPERKR